MKSCSSEAFDARGSWVDGTPPLVVRHLPDGTYESSGWQCPITEWAVSQEKHAVKTNCRSSRNREARWNLWRDYTVGGCDRVATFEVVEPGSTVYFIGDSMSHQHWQAFVCRQLAEGLQRARCGLHACRDRTAQAFGQRPSTSAPDIRCDQSACPDVRIEYPARVWWDEPSRAWWDGHEESSSKLSKRSDCARLVVQGKTYTTCFLEAPLAAVRMLQRAGAVKRGDTLIVNSGLTEKAHNLNSTLRPLATELSRLAQREGRGVRVLWRETHPQHFPPKRLLEASGAKHAAADGFFVFRSGAGRDASAYHKALHLAYKKHGRCEPMASLNRTALHQRDLDLFESAAIPTLRIWRLTSTEWDVHREMLTSHAYTIGALDCTHFCVPSGVMEAWVSATTNALMQSHGRVEEGRGRA